MPKKPILESFLVYLNKNKEIEMEAVQGANALGNYGRDFATPINERKSPFGRLSPVYQGGVCSCLWPRYVMDILQRMTERSGGSPTNGSFGPETLSNMSTPVKVIMTPVSIERTIILDKPTVCAGVLEVRFIQIPGQHECLIQALKKEFQDRQDLLEVLATGQKQSYCSHITLFRGNLELLGELAGVMRKKWRSYEKTMETKKSEWINRKQKRLLFSVETWREDLKKGGITDKDAQDKVIRKRIGTDYGKELVD